MKNVYILFEWEQNCNEFIGAFQSVEGAQNRAREFFFVSKIEFEIQNDESILIKKNNYTLGIIQKIKVNP